MKEKFCDVVFSLPLEQKYTYYVPEKFFYCDLLGKRVEVDFGRKINKVGVVVDVYDELSTLITQQIKPIKNIVDIAPFFDSEQLLTAKWFAKIYLTSWGFFLNQFFPINHKFVMREGIILKKEMKLKEPIDMNFNFLPKSNLKKINLFIPCDLQEKFSFYSNFILNALENDQQVLLILPNTTCISDFYRYLLEQERLKNAFEKIVLYTGEVPLQERYEMWYLIRNKLVNVIISTKIGVFLPFNNISFIIVDEPDSLGYINPEVPMYNSLFILEKRIESYKCKLIYSSFSPSINFIYRHNLISDKKCLQLSENIRINTAKKDLLRVINKNIYKFKQILVLFPYKGTKGNYVCLSCKKIFSKRSFEKITNSKEVFICPDCAGTYYREYSSVDNISKVIGFLKANIKSATISDLLNLGSKDKQYIKKIDDFNNRKIDILIADLSILNYMYKINFYGVGAIYFALMDEFLYKPSYLAYENFYRLIKTFSSLIPKDKAVEFYIETFSDGSILKLVNNYNEFYKEELKIRRELKYPPFSHMIKLQIIDKKDIPIQDFKDKLLKNFEKEKNVEVFIEKEIEKNYKGYNSVFLLKLSDVEMDMIDKVMQDIINLKKQIESFFIVQHNPLI